MPTHELLLIVAVAIGVGLGIGIPGYFAIRLFRRYQAASDTALNTILAEFATTTGPCDPDIVQISFPLYVGFLNTLKTIKLEAVVAKPKAPELLKRLRNFNFKWGLIGKGAVFVPFSTLYHYYKQKRRILASINGST